MLSKNHRLTLIAILALAVLLRVSVALYLGDTVPAGKDETSYATLAARLVTGHGYSFPTDWYPFAPANTPTAHWSFLYTAFLAGVYLLAGPHPLAARLVQAVLVGVLLPWLTYRLARRAGDRGQGTGVRRHGSGGRSQETDAQRKPASPSPEHRNGCGAQETTAPASFRRGMGPGGEVVPLLAALLTAVYAYFVIYGAMVQTEAFYICALLWSLERSLALGETLRRAAAQSDMRKGMWNGSLALGLSLGVATLLRQSILPWVMVLFAWLLWQGYRGGNLRRAVVSTVISALVLGLCILPFTLRNDRVYGDFLLLNSNAGYAMYSAQHPMHGTSFQEYAAAPLPEDLAGQGLNEAQWDKALMARGIRFVLAEPGRYFMLSLSRVRDYFEFWPTADSSLLFNIGRVASFGLFLPFMLYGIYLEVKAKVKAKAEAKARAEAEVEDLSRHEFLPAEATPREAPPERRACEPDLLKCGSYSWTSPEVGYFSTSALTLTLTFVLFYSVLHIATWAMSRYRLPVDAVLLIYAAAGIADLAGRLVTRRRHANARA